jgi:hypothetical protein
MEFLDKKVRLYPKLKVDAASWFERWRLTLLVFPTLYRM